MKVDGTDVQFDVNFFLFYSVVDWFQALVSTFHGLICGDDEYDDNDNDYVW